MTRCACGQVFDHIKDLRFHIAVETDRWPVERCTRAHHDPLNIQDLAALAWRRESRHPLSPPNEESTNG